MASETDANGGKTSYTYDVNGNVRKETDALGQSTTYTYDKCNQLVSVTDAENHTTRYEYDALGRTTKEILSSLASIMYTYDKWGNVIQQTDALRNKVQSAYNEVGLRIQQTDALGNKTSYLYDANGQTTSVTNPNEETITYTYKKLGQKESITYPTKDKVSYTYDAMGNVTKITDTSGGVTRYTYDANHQVVKKQLPNGAVSAYSYEKKGLMRERKESNATNQSVYTYRYDENGNRIKETKKTEEKTTEGKTTERKPTEPQTSTIQYTYDAVNQLIKVTDEKGSRSYTYDAFGNRIRKEESGKERIDYQYNAHNQLVERKRGNLNKVSEPGAETKGYTFDAANELTQVVKTQEGKAEVITTYCYDGDGNRMAKTIESQGKMAADLRYLVDPESAYQNVIMAEEQTTGATAIVTFGIGEEVISERKDGTVSYYQLDDKKSVSEILDAKGKSIETLEYDEFGILVQKGTRKAKDSNFSYTGHLYEESSGLYFAKARYYQAEVGRFLSEDAYRGETSEEGNWNRYTYVKNNPVRYRHPSGNVAFLDDIILLILVSGLAAFAVVAAKDIYSKISQEKLSQASQVIFETIIYPAKWFIKMLSQAKEKKIDWVNVLENNKKGGTKKKTEGKGQTVSI